MGELEASLAKAPLGVPLSPSQAGATERLDTVSPCGSVFKCLVFIRVAVILEKEMATRSSALAWRIPWTEELVATVHGVAESETTHLHTHTHTHTHTHSHLLLDEGWFGSAVTLPLLVPSAIGLFSSKVTF